MVFCLLHSGSASGWTAHLRFSQVLFEKEVNNVIYGRAVKKIQKNTHAFMEIADKHASMKNGLLGQIVHPGWMMK